MTAAEICAHIPHAGEMSLLDAVLAHDKDSIVCTTLSHQRVSNPLRNGNRLDAVNLIEYAAQAMAVHGGLQAKMSNGPVTQGYLAAVRNVKLTAQSLESIQQPLIIRASRLMADNGNMMYTFEVKTYTDSNAGDNTLATGRLTIVAVK